jgi:hypothetical protein
MKVKQITSKIELKRSYKELIIQEPRALHFHPHTHILFLSARSCAYTYMYMYICVMGERKVSSNFGTKQPLSL